MRKIRYELRELSNRCGYWSRVRKGQVLGQLKFVIGVQFRAFLGLLVQTPAAGGLKKLSLSARSSVQNCKLIEQRSRRLVMAFSVQT